MSNKAASQKARSPEGCDENGAAAALLLSHVSIQICSLVAPGRRPILIATPINQSLTWCTRARLGNFIRFRRGFSSLSRLNHLLVGAATWILAFLLRVLVTRPGIVLCFAHNPLVRAPERFWLPLARVRSAFCAVFDLSAALRRRAIDRLCSESASVETVARLSRRSALRVARDRLGDDLLGPDPTKLLQDSL